MKTKIKNFVWSPSCFFFMFSPKLSTPCHCIINSACWNYQPYNLYTVNSSLRQFLVIYMHGSHSTLFCVTNEHLALERYYSYWSKRRSKCPVLFLTIYALVWVSYSSNISAHWLIAKCSNANFVVLHHFKTRQPAPLPDIPLSHITP